MYGVPVRERTGESVRVRASARELCVRERGRGRERSDVQAEVEEDDERMKEIDR